MPPTWTLSGFADEIDPEPRVQAAVLQALGAAHAEVRGAWGTGVLDLDDAQLDRLADAFAAAGTAVSAVASPIGKVDVGLPVEHELARLERAVAVARRLSTPYVRIFSFYRPEGASPESVRDAVLTRMRALADAAERAGVVLLHENEKEIYGDVPERVLDVVESVGSDALRVAWDSANFVQVGVRPWPEGYAMLRPHLAYLQVKDALLATGEVVPAGEGDGRVAETVRALAADGWTGFASLEPHLAAVDRLGGFSGPARFGVAARAFRRLAEAEGVVLA